MLFCMVVAFGTLVVLLVDMLITRLARAHSAAPDRPALDRPEEAGARPAILATIYLGIARAPLHGADRRAAPRSTSRSTRTRSAGTTALLEVNIQNLAAVPSIVYGILGLAFIVRGIGLGRVLLAGALILTLVVLPTVIIASREAIRAVPTRSVRAPSRSARRSGRSSGARCCRRRSPGIATGSILALSRAVGETAPLSWSARSPTSPSTRRSSDRSRRCRCRSTTGRAARGRVPDARGRRDHRPARHRARA